jgi:hypothetical protein
MVLGLIEVVLLASVALSFAIAFLRQRASAGPAEVLVVYGRRSGARGYDLVRGGTLVLPLVEAAERVSLEPIALTLPDGSTATVRFPSDDEALCQCFDRLGIRPRAEIAELAADAVAGAISRAKAPEDAEHEAYDTLGALGLELESLVVNPSRAAPPRA